jgi:hypothetical protein
MDKDLRRALGFWDSVAIDIAAMIGPEPLAEFSSAWNFPVSSSGQVRYCTD